MFAKCLFQVLELLPFGSAGHNSTKQQDEENNETRGPLPIGQLAILGMNQCQTKRTTLATPPGLGPK